VLESFDIILDGYGAYFTPNDGGGMASTRSGVQVTLLATPCHLPPKTLLGFITEREI
jgi:hypothetical protein